MLRWIVRALVAVTSPPARREMVIGDLEEEWAERIRPRAGIVAAEWWYAREGLSLAIAFVRDRVRDKWNADASRRMRRRRRSSGGTMQRRSGRDGWIQDIRQTIRGLVRQPAFAVTAAMTLAIGIGGTTVMFTLVHAAYLRPLPFPDADRLVHVFTGYQNDRTGRNSIAALTWQDARERPDLVDAIEVWEPRSYHLSEEGTVRRIDAARVSPGLFDLLGARRAIGRLFLESEGAPGEERKVILSDGMWQQTFGGDSAVLGRMLVLDDVAYEVVGVLDEAFDLPRGAELWVPLALGPVWYTPGRRGWEFLDAVARLNVGVSADRAADGLTEQLERHAPQRVANVGQRVNVVSMREHIVGDAGTALLFLLAAVTLVLLIGGANVMNLLLTRAETRRREFALRRALGSGATRLARLVVLEIGMLAAAGFVLGVLGAVVITSVIAASPPDSLASLGALTISWPVVIIALLLSVGIALVFGLVPVGGALALQPAEVLRENTARVGASRHAGAIRSMLVVVEVALAVILLFGVGVTAESFRRLMAVDPGFQREGRLVLNLEAPAAGTTREEWGAAYRRILDRVRIIPGVSSAALVYAMPLTGVAWSASFELAEPDPNIPDAAQGANMRPASPGYFETAGIPLIEGRPLDETDRLGAPPVVVVDETVARRVWPTRSAIGQRIDLGVFVGGVREAAVVGVVGNVRDRNLHTAGSGHMYFSSWQSPQRRMTLLVHSPGDPLALAPAIRAAIAEVEPRVPVYQMQPATALVAQSLAPARLSLLLMASFGTAALLLAAVGVYGVVSYTVALQTREIGTRIALGATPSNVLTMVLRRIARLWLAGSALGAVVALSAQTIAQGLLFDVEPGNPAILSATVLGLGLVALGAAVLPARRAARLDCVEALRVE